MRHFNAIGRENRLCFLLAEDANTNVRYTRRVADANAARQEMQRANTQMNTFDTTQKLIDGKLTTVNTQGPLTTSTAAGERAMQDLQNRAAGVDYNATQTGTRTGPSYADIMDQATIGAQGLRTNFNQRTGNIQSDATRVNTGQIDEGARERLIASGMTPEQAASTIQGNRGDVQQAFNQVGTGSAQDDYMTKLVEEANKRYPGNQEGANAYIKSVLDMDTARANNEKANAPTTTPTAPTVPGGAPTTPTTAGAPTIPGTETPAPTDPTATGVGAAFANLPPEAQFLAPFLSQFQQSIQQSLTENANLTQGLLGDVQKTYGGIQSELDTMKQGYIDSTEAMNGLLEEVRNNNEETIAKQRKAEEDRLAWEEYKGRSTLQKQKRESHDAMVAQIALAGGFGQDAGIRAVMESDAEFESKMSDLAIQFTYARTDLAAKFTGLYNENQNNYISETIANTKELRSSLERIGMQSIANQTARQQAEQGIIEKAWNNQVNLRNTLATQNLNVAGQISETIYRQQQDKLNLEASGWAQLKQARDTYGANIPQAMIDSISKKLPGVDVRSVAVTPTAAERKKMAGSGGGWGSSTPGSNDSGPGGIFSEYASMTPQQLSSAVDRAMLKFGGTGAERNEKRNEYKNRIASGESPGAIVDDLIKDYWVSKGSDKGHDDRINAAGNMETILSFAEAYGITQENDGPLGPFDSRANWLGSFVKLSSEEYNELRSVVSNVKGQITKANAGTAVSAQELALLKEYAPSMDLTGPTFFANVQNYKQLVNYLDAKQAAMDLGLPAPKVPMPITMTGNDLAGPGKYSDSDILSAL